jgi:hypothetical protein
LALADEVVTKLVGPTEVDELDVGPTKPAPTKSDDVDEDVDKARRTLKFEVPTKFKVRPIELETVPRASQVRG